MPERQTELISADAIANAVKRLAQRIDDDHAGQSLVIIGILKGSFIFLADLARQIQSPVERIEFIRLSSYGSGTVSAGTAKLELGIAEEKICDRNILVVEDIVDTGITTQTALNYLQSHRPASLKLCTLLDKPERRQVQIAIDYLGFTVPNVFIVGYGIDYAEKYRQLPAIYQIDESHD